MHTKGVLCNFKIGKISLQIKSLYNGGKITEDYLTVETIPAHTYAVFKCVGKMPVAFQKVYKYACTEFFPASEYRPCGIEIESYPSAGTENADYTCEIWIAVEKNNN